MRRSEISRATLGYPTLRRFVDQACGRAEWVASGNAEGVLQVADSEKEPEVVGRPPDGTELLVEGRGMIVRCVHDPNSRAYRVAYRRNPSSGISQQTNAKAAALVVLVDGEPSEQDSGNQPELSSSHRAGDLLQLDRMCGERVVANDRRRILAFEEYVGPGGSILLSLPCIAQIPVVENVSAAAEGMAWMPLLVENLDLHPCRNSSAEGFGIGQTLQFWDDRGRRIEPTLECLGMLSVDSGRGERSHNPMRALDGRTDDEVGHVRSSQLRRTPEQFALLRRHSKVQPAVFVLTMRDRHLIT